jgi:uncharacterized membrane protein
MTTSHAGSGIPEAMQQAKRPRSPAAGPYGHPFHPVLVTVPIGAWVAALIFDIVAVSGSEGEVFGEGAYWLILIGIVGALVAAVFGLMDLMGIPRGTRAFKTGITHMGLNLTVVALFVINYLIRLGQGYEEVTALQLILTIVGLAILGASGWLGGMLAYHYGVRVADETTQAEGYR